MPWTETSGERTYQASLNGYVISIAEEQTVDNFDETVWRYVIRFYDTSGKLLDTATSNDFPTEYKFEGKKNAWDALRDLHDLARHKALKVGQALDELLRSL